MLSMLGSSAGIRITEEIGDGRGCYIRKRKKPPGGGFEWRGVAGIGYTCSRAALAIWSLPGGQGDHGQPAAYLFRKQEKSLTLSVGAVVEPSQLAKGSPAANLLRKQEKSLTLRTGATTLLSQLA